MKNLKVLVSASLLTICFIAVHGFTNKQLSDMPVKHSPSGNITVSGGGSFEELGSKTTYTFNAVQQSNGRTTGHLILQFRAADSRMFVKLDCLRLFGQNKVTMSGIITSLTQSPDFPPPPFIYVGGRVSFTVQDNGEGNAATPDLLSDIGELTMRVSASCSDEWPLYLATDGNVQINR
jgi:hypothetical protein